MTIQIISAFFAIAFLGTTTFLFFRLHSLTQSRKPAPTGALEALHFLTNFSQALIWTSGLNKDCDYFNDSWLKFRGRTLQEEIGNGWVQGIHPEDRETCFSTYVENFECRTSFDMAYRIGNAAGEYRWIRDMGSPRFDSKGTFLGYAGICFDITEQKKTEESLRENEERFRTIFYTSPDAISIVKISDGTYIEVNEGFFRMSGCSRDELLGKSALDIQIWENPNDRTRLLQLIREQGFFENQEVRFHIKDGSIIIGLMSAKKISLAGEPQLLAITREITAWRQSQIEQQETNHWLQEAQRIARLGYYVFDIVEDCWSSSEMLDEIFGIDKSFVRNAASWVNLVHPSDKKDIADFLINDVIGQKKPFNREYRVQRNSDQAVLWVIGRGELEFNAEGNPIRMFGTIQDITEQKNTELEKDRLVHELKTRQAEQESLIYAMSHDLRSPLVNVLGFASELEKEIAIILAFPEKFAVLSASVQDSIHFIVKSAQRMDRLQTGILRYARLGRMEFTLQKIDCRSVIDHCIQGLEHQARSLNITFINRVEHTCIADLFAFEQVCNNLLDNAIKYSRPNIPPIICISSIEELGNIILSFQDNGTGIPIAYRSKVFEIFHRLEPHGKINGEGLGLTLVRGLLHHMNGHISISEKHAEPGTEFLVTLPAA